MDNLFLLCSKQQNFGQDQSQNIIMCMIKKFELVLGRGETFLEKDKMLITGIFSFTHYLLRAIKSGDSVIKS